MEADIVVKTVMLGLLLASIWTWTIIVSFGMNITKIARKSDKFEQAFGSTDNIDRFFDAHGQSSLPSAKVLAAGVKEWRRSTAKGPVDREGTRQRLASPFVGLFGTVWGIMRSFSAIAAEQNSSLAVVAPGIAEALFATAIGLFAAIPAVIAYNRFSHRLNKLEARMGRFADSFHATLSRELEVGN